MPMSTPEAQREYQREWRAKRRSDFMEDKTCVRCGSEERLELDHIDASQKVAHGIWSWSAQRREAEIAKCQILCHDCHVAKTRESKEHWRGEKVTSSKLTEQQVTDIRRVYAEGSVSYRDLEKIYGVDHSVIGRAIRHETWNG